LNHRHRKILHQVFAHPLNHTLDIGGRASAGAELDHTGNGDLRAKFGGTQETLHLGGHSVTGDDVMRVDPGRDYPL